MDNITSKELFYRAKQWLVKTYVSAKNVTQMEDIEQGTLMVKAIIPVYTTFAVKAKLGAVSYTFTISVKDNRYRYVISDLWHDTLYNTEPGSAINTPGDLTLEKPGGGIYTMGIKNWNGIKIQTKEYIDTLIKSLQENMTKPSIQSDNW